MSESGATEIPIVFQCEGDSLVGVVHRPQTPPRFGLVTIIAGGPQYRAGVGRGMVSTARYLADRGVAVLRFEYRGMGDSAGDFYGFERITEDISAAVEALKCEVPEIEQVLLWGGCDAASGAMIHSWKVPGVSSLVLGNPWVTTYETHTAAMNKHYLSRLGEWSFWRKLLRFEYNLFDYARAGGGKFWARLSRIFAASPGSDDDSGSFVDRMLAGFEKFEGPVLLLVSGQSVASREFDELLDQDARWKAACERPGHKRIDFPEADQTFSDKYSRECVYQAIVEWVAELDARQS